MSLLEKIREHSDTIMLEYCAECIYYSWDTLVDDNLIQWELTEELLMKYAKKLKDIHDDAWVDISLGRLADALVKYDLDVDNEEVLNYYNEISV